MMEKGWEKDVCLWMIEVVDGCLFFTIILLFYEEKICGKWTKKDFLNVAFETFLKLCT